jgi:hypothetical protein
VVLDALYTTLMLYESVEERSVVAPLVVLLNALYTTESVGEHGVTIKRASGFAGK